MPITTLGGRVAACLLAASTGLLASPIVTNNSFETPTTASALYQPAGGTWAFTDKSGFFFNGAFQTPGPPDGTQSAYLQQCGVGSLCNPQVTDGPGSATISQSISGFTAGNNYTVSFYLGDRGFTLPMPVEVQIGALSLGTFTPDAGIDFDLTTSPSFTAGASTLTLTFIAAFSDTNALAGTEADALIDLVQFQDLGPAPTGVPEPSTMILFAPALLGLAMARRRRP